MSLDNTDRAFLPNEQTDTNKPPAQSAAAVAARAVGAALSGRPVRAPSKTRRRKPKPRGRTGPTTEEGKERAKLNALKHGLATELGIIPGHEDPDEWREFRDGIVESLTPVGRLEETLAELVARGLWRHDRALRNEAYNTMENIEAAADVIAALANYRAAREGGVVDEKAMMEEIIVEHLRRILPAKDDLELGMRYEGHVQRQWKTALHELQVLQARRLGERPNVMRFDVTHSAA